ncbi:hypothetical protein QR680_007183 [Steinernema hermaphroditum]|uniref:Uncharacterized protein n=1 Tax=Steinernema hermaphroditum TaxID=289476 RepID=A0AA39HY15_9BILA|nr:hypothetical protein QR680_007183 [Steinernema hermaphroditum]
MDEPSTMSLYTNNKQFDYDDNRDPYNNIDLDLHGIHDNHHFVHDNCKYIHHIAEHHQYQHNYKDRRTNHFDDNYRSDDLDNYAVDHHKYFRCSEHHNHVDFNDDRVINLKFHHYSRSHHF